MRGTGSATSFSRRGLLKAAGAAAAAGALGALGAACQPQAVEKPAEKTAEKAGEKPAVAPAAPPTAAGPVEITFSTCTCNIRTQDFDVFGKTVDLFEQAHDGKIKVRRTFDPSPDHFKIFNKFRAGTMEDVGWINDDSVFFLSSAGSLLILDDFVKRDMKRDDYYDRVWKARNAPGDQIAALSNGAIVSIAYYNKKHFAEAGVKAPTDWTKDAWTVDQWEQNLTRMTVRAGDRAERYGGSIPRCVGYNWQPQTGIAPYNEDETKAQFNHPEVVKFFERLTDWVLKHKIALPLTENALELFNAGKLPIMWGSNTTFPLIAKEIEWGWMPPMKYKVDPPISFPSDQTYSTPAATKHPEEAWQLNKWFMLEPAQRMLAEVDAVIPALKKVAESEKYLNQPPGNRKMLVDAFKNGWLTPTNNPMGEQLAVLMCREDLAMLTGQEPVKVYLDKRTERMNAFIAENQWTKKNDRAGYRLPGIPENMGMPKSVPETAPYQPKMTSTGVLDALAGMPAPIAADQTVTRRGDGCEPCLTQSA